MHKVEDSNISQPLQRYAALVSDGSKQQWIEKNATDEEQFRRYLNTQFAFHICLYCQPVENLA